MAATSRKVALGSLEATRAHPEPSQCPMMFPPPLTPTAQMSVEEIAETPWKYELTGNPEVFVALQGLQLLTSAFAGEAASAPMRAPAATTDNRRRGQRPGHGGEQGPSSHFHPLLAS